MDDLETLLKTCLNELKVNSSAREQTPQKSSLLTLDELKSFITSYIWKIHEQIESNRQEGSIDEYSIPTLVSNRLNLILCVKVQIYNDALVQLNLLNANKRSSSDEDCLNLLTSVLQKRHALRADESAESSEGECAPKPTARKFPFKQTYD